MRSALAVWFEENQRDLPWRRDSSLYSTVVSEFMLQQTQVKTVVPYFNQWLKRFPDFSTLARAKEATVLKHWEGLGYYSRARNLHQLAKDLAQLDSIPEDPLGWQQFKGIGAYTAAAITSLTFKHPAACVDGNVIRILARLTADETLFKDNNQAGRTLGPWAELLLDKDEPGRHNEAMMELGATVCTKANPLCASCPLHIACKGSRDRPERFPRKPVRKPRTETIHRAWVIRGGKLLLHRAGKNSRRLADILELPKLEHLGLPHAALAEKGHSPLRTGRRGISNTLITESIWEITKPVAVNQKELEWVSLKKIATVTLSGPHKRWIGAILRDRQLAFY